MMGSQNSPVEPVKLGDGSPSFTHARLQSCWKAIFHILRHASYRWSAPSETVHTHTHTHLAVIRRIVPPLILWPDKLGTRGLFACFASTASGEQHLNKVQTEAGCCPIRGQPRQSGWAEQRCSAKKKNKTKREMAVKPPAWCCVSHHLEHIQSCFLLLFQRQQLDLSLLQQKIAAAATIIKNFKLYLHTHVRTKKGKLQHSVLGHVLLRLSQREGHNNSKNSPYDNTPSRWYDIYWDIFFFF